MWWMLGWMSHDSHPSPHLSLYLSLHPSHILPLLKVLLPKMLAFFKISANKVTRYNVLMMVCAIDISFLKWAELFNFNEKFGPRVKPSTRIQNTRTAKQTENHCPDTRINEERHAALCFTYQQRCRHLRVFVNWFRLSQELWWKLTYPSAMCDCVDFLFVIVACTTYMLKRCHEARQLTI